MVSEGVNFKNGWGVYVYCDCINGVLWVWRGVWIVVIIFGGVILEMVEFCVVIEDEWVVVGMVDEDFVIDFMVGSIFLFGNNLWCVVGLWGGDLVVNDVYGMLFNILFWFGEVFGCMIEFFEEVFWICVEIVI